MGLGRRGAVLREAGDRRPWLKASAAARAAPAAPRGLPNAGMGNAGGGCHARSSPMPDLPPRHEKLGVQISCGTSRFLSAGNQFSSSKRKTVWAKGHTSASWISIRGKSVEDPHEDKSTQVWGPELRAAFNNRMGLGVRSKHSAAREESGLLYFNFYFDV